MLVGKYIILLGLVVVVIGLLIYYFGNIFSWIGNLPGDIRIEKGNTKIYFPITTMVLITLIINIVIRVLRKI